MRRAFVDTETTGISQSARIIEVGYVLDDDDWPRTFWLPYERAAVEPGAHTVNHLGSGGRPPSGSRLTVGAAVQKMQSDWRDRELVFNNPAFDIWMIRKLFEAVPGAEPTWRYHSVDVKMLLIGAARVATNADREQWLPADVKPEPEVHDALSGAYLVKRQFEAYEALRSVHV